MAVSKADSRSRSSRGNEAPFRAKPGNAGHGKIRASLPRLLQAFRTILESAVGCQGNNPYSHDNQSPDIPRPLLCAFALRLKGSDFPSVSIRPALRDPGPSVVKMSNIFG